MGRHQKLPAISAMALRRLVLRVVVDPRAGPGLLSAQTKPEAMQLGSLMVCAIGFSVAGGSAPPSRARWSFEGRIVEVSICAGGAFSSAVCKVSVHTFRQSLIRGGLCALVQVGVGGALVAQNRHGERRPPRRVGGGDLYSSVTRQVEIQKDAADPAPAGQGRSGAMKRDS